MAGICRRRSLMRFSPTRPYPESPEPVPQGGSGAVGERPGPPPFRVSQEYLSVVTA